MSKLLSIAKRTVNRILKQLNHRVEHVNAIPSFDRLVEYLKQAGLAPQTVFDVGIAAGTPWLYAAFPKAKYFLFDPTPQSLPYMQSIAKTIDAEIMNFALGNADGEIKFKIREDHAGSTIFDEIGEVEVLSENKVPIRRFDAVIKDFARPSLMKIDIQGAELMMLEGVGDRMADLDCIIVETAIIATLKGQPEFADVVHFMKERDFVLYEITDIIRRPLDQFMACVDAVFVPVDSPLRRDRRWSA